VTTFDALNRSSATLDPSSNRFTFSYDAAGQRTTLLMGNGSKRLYSYDLAGRLTTQIEQKRTSVPVVTMVDTYDNAGNLTKVAAPAPAGTTTMVYDKENRLTRHESGGVVSTYTYAGDGLKRSEQVSGALTTLVWDGDEYLQGRS
jgi:YD repeat-containing protein